MHTITFYSYKGGTGRTLAVANTARFLERFGYKVFVLDLDLEAPGLHYKFGLRTRGNEASEEAGDTSLRGFVDVVHEIKSSGLLPDLSPYVHTVGDSQAKSGGHIWLMPAGNAPSAAYSHQLSSLRLEELFQYTETSQIPAAVPLFLALKRKIAEFYEPDYLLIDSRTGVTEIGSVAVRLLPDTVVCLTHNNDENLAGARKVLRNVRAASRLEEQEPIDIVVALTRIPEMSPDVEKTMLEGVKLYFNEPSEKLRENLALSEVLPLHSDPDLQVSETLRFGASTTANESILLRDYYKLFHRLGLDKHLPPGAKAVLNELAGADSKDSVRSLLLSNRRFKGESSVAPISMRERLMERSNPRLKVVLPAYLEGSVYRRFANCVLDRLRSTEGLPDLAPLQLDPIPPADVRWDLLAVHLREGVVDFCADIYYLTENRAHLVEIVQLGWSNTFTTFCRRDSQASKELTHISSPNFSEGITRILKAIPELAIGVRGDTPAASEANRRLSPLLQATKLISRESEQDLFDWASNVGDEERLVICDHPVAFKLQNLSEDNQNQFSIGPCFHFEQPIPVGLVYPREDREWRRKISKAVAYSLLDLFSSPDWNWGASASISVSKDFEHISLVCLSLEDLHTSLLLDLPFEEAIDWDAKFQVALNSPKAVDSGSSC